MKLSYYPGCSLQGTALDYDKSVREVCAALDIDLLEIPDWNCCGASSAHMTNHEIGNRLPMRNLLLNLDHRHDILVPCAACYQRLRAADIALREDPEFWDVEAYSPDFRILHISTFLAEPEIIARIQEKIIRNLDDLPIACYYGCLSLRPPKVTGARNFEMPTTLETIVEALGAAPVRWAHRTECCSGSLTMARPDIARKLVGDINTAARRGGAKAFVTDCPMCQANLESRQLDNNPDDSLPAFFATELIVAAMNGVYPQKQKKLHLVRPDVLADLFTAQEAAGEERP
ncbi:MAG: heterodisulfide reductase-related iron-sulfur binding cluster [Desulfocapsaceae bacterium]|nr:heterodisulfide reductase-related iron-sulfur binding cluster [Desulfocapsaceae bacterium]